MPPSTPRLHHLLGALLATLLLATTHALVGSPEADADDGRAPAAADRPPVAENVDLSQPVPEG